MESVTQKTEHEKTLIHGGNMYYSDVYDMVAEVTRITARRMVSGQYTDIKIEKRDADQWRLWWEVHDPRRGTQI